MVHIAQQWRISAHRVARRRPRARREGSGGAWSSDDRRAEGADSREVGHRHDGGLKRLFAVRSGRQLSVNSRRHFFLACREDGGIHNAPAFYSCLPADQRDCGKLPTREGQVMQMIMGMQRAISARLIAGTVGNSATSISGESTASHSSATSIAWSPRCRPQ